MEPKELKYISLVPQIKNLIDAQCNEIANYANVAAAIQAEFKHWWCGFYFVNTKNQLERKISLISFFESWDDMPR